MHCETVPADYATASPGCCSAYTRWDGVRVLSSATPCWAPTSPTAVRPRVFRGIHVNRDASCAPDSAVTPDRITSLQFSTRETVRTATSGAMMSIGRRGHLPARIADCFEGVAVRRLIERCLLCRSERITRRTRDNRRIQLVHCDACGASIRVEYDPPGHSDVAALIEQYVPSRRTA